MVASRTRQVPSSRRVTGSMGSGSTTETTDLKSWENVPSVQNSRASSVEKQPASQPPVLFSKWRMMRPANACVSRSRAAASGPAAGAVGAAGAPAAGAFAGGAGGFAQALQ